MVVFTMSRITDHNRTPIAVPTTNKSDIISIRKMARVTGLEPAASGVTGRRSNQLSYTRK